MKIKLTTSHPVTYNPQMGPVTELTYDSSGYDGHNSELDNWLNLVNMPLNKIVYPEGDDESKAIEWFKFEVLER